MPEKMGTSIYEPIEVTTHNIYFHDESPIFSVDGFNGLIATSGCDKVIRLWLMNLQQENYKENVYRTAADSSITLELFGELGGFVKPINCLRFYHMGEDTCGLASKYLLAACSDSGKVIVYEDGSPTVIRREDGDDAYDMCWDDSKLFVGFASGRVEVYNMEFVGSDTPDQAAMPAYIFKMSCVHSPHKGTVQGMSYNGRYGLLATHSLDRSVKISRFEENGPEVLSTFDEKIDSSRGLYKRLMFNEKNLFVFGKGNMVNVYAYPFKKCHLQMKIGPLNAPVVKILEYNELTFICTKKSLYIFKKQCMLVCIDEITFMTITDACMCDGVLFISAMDGFLVSVRFTIPKALITD